MNSLDWMWKLKGEPDSKARKLRGVGTSPLNAVKAAAQACHDEEMIDACSGDWPHTILVRNHSDHGWCAYEVERRAVPEFTTTRDPANDAPAGA